MRNTIVYLCAFIFAIGVGIGYAEKVYYKDGTSRGGTVTSRGKDSITLEIKGKDASSPIEIPLKDILRIDNDDDSTSRFDYPSLVKKAQEAISAKDYTAAIDFYTSLLVSFPDNLNIRYLRGILCHKLGDLKDAESDYTYLIDNKGADSFIYNNIGTIYARQKNYDEALKWFIMALRDDPKRVETRENIGEVYLATKRYDGAIREYSLAAETNTADPGLLYSLGLAFACQQEYEKACQAWEKVIDLAPQEDIAENAKKMLSIVLPMRKKVDK